MKRYPTVEEREALKEAVGEPARRVIDDVPIPHVLIRAVKNPNALGLFVSLMPYYHMQDLLTVRFMAGAANISTTRVATALTPLIEGGWMTKATTQTEGGAHVTTSYTLNPLGDGPGHTVITTVPNPRPRRMIEPSIWVEILNRDNFQCVDCGSIKDLTADHIIPIVLGGTDAAENLQVLCRPCNSRKGAEMEADQ